MVWSHLLYDKLFSNNICMLIIDLLYVTQFLNSIYVAFVVPDTGSSRKSRNMFIYFLQETLTHVIDRHDIQLDSVQRDLGIMTPDMIMFQLRHHGPERLTVTVNPHSILNHCNLACRCGRRYLYCHSPLNETR